MTPATDFDVRQFDVNVEHRINAMGERVTVSLAVVKVNVGGEEQKSGVPVAAILARNVARMPLRPLPRYSSGTMR